ncbi:DUF2202 domain-containing protein [Archaeoglobus sp.]
MKRWIVLVLLALAFLGCAQQTQTPTEKTPVKTVVGAGSGKGRGGQGYGEKMGPNGSVNVQYLRDYVMSVRAGNLTETEKEGILYMVEEEKLAHDVYTTLYEKWRQRIFANIAKSEETHVNAVRLLIEKYNLTDPTEGKKVGEFSNPKFEELYKKLVKEGEKSLIDALKVGAMIEELDIVDLKERINQTDKPDIKMVYENLMKGSRNHLRAFVYNLNNLGVSYKPVYLSKNEFEEIVKSEWERGGMHQ